MIKFKQPCNTSKKNSKKKIFMFLIFAVLLFISICVKNREEVVSNSHLCFLPFEEFNKDKKQDLILLCKIWGFLKYYHPEIAKGKFDMDDELFKILPDIVKSKSKDERNQIFYKWIKSFGDITVCKCDFKQTLTPNLIKIYPDLLWTEDKTILGDVSKLLIQIRNAKRENKNQYVSLITENQNPTFVNEKSYIDISYPAPEYQLLALFRYWNVIEYFYPYKYLINKNWDDILSDFIPQFIQVKSEDMYLETLLCLITTICDTHASIYDIRVEHYKGLNFIPVEISFVENNAIVTDIYSTSHFQIPFKKGDIILGINSISIDSIIRQKKDNTPASNYTTKLREIATDLLRTNLNELLITYDHNGDTISEFVKCMPIAMAQNNSRYQKNRSLSKILNKEVLYLYLGSSIGGKIPPCIDFKGVIIDLRCYPSAKVENYWDFFDLYENKVEFAKVTTGSITNPGLFTFTESLEVGKKNEKYLKGKKVILVNELTQSHAEFMAMKYKAAPNTVIIGSTTAGADGNISELILPGNIKTYFTGIGIYYPDGKETQKVGIIPDIECKQTIKGIRMGKDEILEEALKIISGDI